LRGLRMYENLGFVREGVLRQHRRKAGKFIDKLVYGILETEWLSRANSKDQIHEVISQL
jgi:RimJ/RimL family protein N-acetyltransferase